MALLVALIPAMMIGVIVGSLYANKYFEKLFVGTAVGLALIAAILTFAVYPGNYDGPIESLLLLVYGAATFIVVGITTFSGIIWLRWTGVMA